MKSLIYYTDNRLGEPIFSTVKEYLIKSDLPIVSASLKPMDFGQNEFFLSERGYPSMVTQILSCLERTHSDYVFFCEHDVLYPESHFDFTPPRKDIFYYNRNVWRWMFGSDKAIRYERMLPLSCLCCATELARDHYRMRWEQVMAHLEEFNSPEPGIARKWGYEPGTKKKKRGGLTDDDFETWYSAEPVIDIRHSDTYSPPKVALDSFKHAPVNWQETDIQNIPGWDLKEMFHL